MNFPCQVKQRPSGIGTLHHKETSFSVLHLVIADDNEKKLTRMDRYAWKKQWYYAIPGNIWVMSIAGGGTVLMYLLVLLNLFLPEIYLCLSFIGLPGPSGPPGRPGSSMSTSGSLLRFIHFLVPWECPVVLVPVCPWLWTDGAKGNLYHVVVVVIKKCFCFNYRNICLWPTRSTRSTRPEGRPRWVPLPYWVGDNNTDWKEGRKHLEAETLLPFCGYKNDC